MKKIRKILPLSIYDIPGIEAWLETQANAGLFPVSLNTWGTFTPDGIPGTRFRLVVNERMTDAIPPEQRELFEKAGWHYACAVGRMYFLFYTADPAAVEVYSDWESRGLSLEPLEKELNAYRRRTRILCAVMAAAVIWALFFFESEFDVQPDHFTRLALILLNLFQPTALLFLVCAVWLWRHRRRERRQLQRIHQALSQGLAPPPSPGPSKAIARENIIMLAMIPVLAAALLLTHFDSLNPWHAIPLERFSEPYISMQSIERETVLPFEELFDEESEIRLMPNREPENYAGKKFSFLAPTWYHVKQYVFSPQSVSEGNYYSPKPQNIAGCYAPELEAAYFRLLFPALSRPVAKAQMDVYRLVNLNWSYQELSYPGLDFAILADEPEGVWQMLAIGKGGRVAVFRYGGREQLSAHLQALSQAVNGVPA